MRWGGLLVVFVLAGCVSVSPHKGAEPGSAPVATSATLPRLTLLVDREFKLSPGAFEFDVLCQAGGAYDIPRVQGALVPNGSRELAITVDAPPESTGIQIGYAFDKDKPKWTETAFNEKREFRVPVLPDQWEPDEALWHFSFSQNVKGAEQSCYTGASLASHVTIEAIAPGSSLNHGHGRPLG